MDAYTRLFQFMRLFRPHKLLTFRYERELERNQWLDREEIRRIAWQKLKKLLEHANGKVPFYRQRFQEMGLTPQDIQTPDDFCRFPILTKNDIRENEDLLIAEGFSKDTMRRAVTSGSTGVPSVVYHDHFFEAMNVAVYARSRRWYGWEFGDKVAWIWGRREDIPRSYRERLIYHLKRERWLDSYKLTSERMRQYAETLARWKPDLIAGYSNVIYLLAQYLESQHLSGIRPKFVETTAMPLWPRDRALIEKVFQCPVSDRYGSFESGSVVSSHCPLGNRHIFIDCCYLEILKNGRPAPAGVAGEVIATPLYSVGMPLLRYHMGDIAAWDDRPCPCGRGLPLLGDIVGRITSIFTLPSGRLLYGGAFGHLVPEDTLAIRRFRVHQLSPDRIEVTLERGRNFDSSVVDAVRTRCLEILGGEPVELTITITDEIPSTAAGKYLVVTSDVPARLN